MNRISGYIILFLTVVSLHLARPAAALAARGGAVRVPVEPTIGALLAEEDTDGDLKITVLDLIPDGGTRGDGRFRLTGTGGTALLVEGTWPLSILLQELALMRESGADTASLDPALLAESPVSRISRLIRERYWDGLTRRVDLEHLDMVLPDDKVDPGGAWRLYVPLSDQRALEYFRSARSRIVAGLPIEVVPLPGPAGLTPESVLSLRGRHGLLTLALRESGDGIEGVPYVVPGGRFNEMYGWDSYFEALGLIADGRVDLARGMVDDFVYEIEHYGKILNANRSYYLTRSQPPLLTAMILAVWEAMDDTSRAGSKEWLARAVRAAIREYREVWTSGAHLTPTGLSRYYGAGIGRPPEVEPGHFDEVYRPFAAERAMGAGEFERLYAAREIDVPALDLFHTHDRAMRESGHDRSYRWFVPGERIADRDRCADFITVDLNCLLYRYELDIARVIRDEFDGRLATTGGGSETGEDWDRRAAARRELIRRYLWNGDLGLFTDRNLVTGEPWPYITAAAFYPLWARDPGDPQTLLFDQSACSTIVFAALEALEEKGGLAASSGESLRSVEDRPAESRQWDYPYGWAPHQMIAWRGLIESGFEREAHRLIYKWLYMIAANARDYNGTIPEKFDVVARSHRVFAEYGNVGTDFSYITEEGFGWMNASFQVGLALLPADLRRQLEELVPPERVFAR